MDSNLARRLAAIVGEPHVLTGIECSPYVLEGRTCLRAERPVNASGGLKAKGHPVGATGVGQICDVALQIRGGAGELQLDRHSLGLAQNLGGSGATAVVTVLGGI